MCSGRQDRPCGSVASHQHLVRHVKAHLNVLARAEAQDGLVWRELEGVCATVFGNMLTFEELDGYPSMFLEGKFVIGLLSVGGVFDRRFGTLLDEVGSFLGDGADDAFC